jgi:acyl-CoA thioester hydrolase
MGHMNVAHYVSKFDEATWHVFRICGITNAYLKENTAAMAGIHQEIDYKRELVPGDTIRVESTVTEPGTKKLAFVHHMYDELTDELVASCSITAVHIDSATRRAKEFSQSIQAKMKEVTTHR